MLKQNGSIFLCVFLIILRTLVQSAPYRDTRIGYAEAGNPSSGEHYAEAGLANWDQPDNRGDLFYGRGEVKDGVRGEAGAINFKAGKGFAISQNLGTVGADLKWKPHQGGENDPPGKIGVMGRVTAYDGTVHAGPVDVNYGVGVFDTGVMIDDGLEVMALGVGFKAAKNRDGKAEVKFCIWICIGFAG